MIRGVRFFVVALFCLVIAVSLMLGGCTRYADEEQMTTLDESGAAAMAAEKKVEDLEKEKAALEAKVNEKQEELQKVQAEKEKVQSKL